MKWQPLHSILRSCLCTVALGGVQTFDALPPGQAPSGWAATKTGTGVPCWGVEQDASAPSKPNVLKQSGTATFPICLYEAASFRDGFVEVRLKPISGKEDQAGGVLWRCQDLNNYYIARANALEDNVTIYHTIQGKRIGFKSVSLKVATNTWHTLRVDFHGNRFVVSFDGQKVLDAHDESLTAAGKVGLWTKADSVMLFDDFRFAGE
jgi:hypothetical protein